MGVDGHECCECEEYLFDCFKGCNYCGEDLGQYCDRVCKDCYHTDDDDKYEKHKIQFHSKSCDIKFDLCEKCIYTNGDDKLLEMYNYITDKISNKNFTVESVRKHVKLEYFIRTLDYHKQKYFSPEAKIKELELEIENNVFEITQLEERNYKLLDKIAALK